jgi:hypothetical protein
MEDRWLARAGRVMWNVGTSKIVAPSVSVKDQWFGHREQVLNILIIC